MAHSAPQPCCPATPTHLRRTATPAPSRFPQVLHRCWTPRCVQRNPRGDAGRLPGRGVLVRAPGHPPGGACPALARVATGRADAAYDHCDGACGRETRWAVRRLAGVSGRSIPAAAVAAALFFASGCGLIGGPSKVLVAVPDNITVTSPDLSGKQVSQAFRFTAMARAGPRRFTGRAHQRGTKSLALVMDDSAAPITPYIFWIVFNIGPQSSDIPAGQLPPGARRADNSKGTIGYDPPCPANPGHVYRFTVYALDRKLSLPSGVSAKTAWMAIAAAAIARGRLASVINP